MHENTPILKFVDSKILKSIADKQDMCYNGLLVTVIPICKKLYVPDDVISDYKRISIIESAAAGRILDNLTEEFVEMLKKKKKSEILSYENIVKRDNVSCSDISASLIESLHLHYKDTPYVKIIK